MIRAVILLAVVASAFAVPHHTIRSTFGGRIVNGTDAPAGKYPSMVSYQWFGTHKCGGTILNENWVLTAAHCIEGDTTDLITVLSGTVRLTRGGTRHPTVELIAHENYNPITLENDIALVRVSTPFVWDDVTQPVSLPSQGQQSPGGSDATVIGWGLPYTGGSGMNDLQEVDYWVVTDQECIDVHSLEVFPTNICAYFPGGGKGQCSGDSGGPLFVNRQYQAGIVSWSEKPCTIAPYPGVFTEVSAYIDWINANIN